VNPAHQRTEPATDRLRLRVREAGDVQFIVQPEGSEVPWLMPTDGQFAEIERDCGVTFLAASRSRIRRICAGHHVSAFNHRQRLIESQTNFKRSSVTAHIRKSQAINDRAAEAVTAQLEHDGSTSRMYAAHSDLFRWIEAELGQEYADAHAESRALGEAYKAGLDKLYRAQDVGIQINSGENGKRSQELASLIDLLASEFAFAAGRRATAHYNHDLGNRAGPFLTFAFAVCRIALGDGFKLNFPAFGDAVSRLLKSVMPQGTPTGEAAVMLKQWRSLEGYLGTGR
jgi:hypothetical protein